MRTTMSNISPSSLHSQHLPLPRQRSQLLLSLAKLPLHLHSVLPRSNNASCQIYCSTQPDHDTHTSR